MVEFSSSNESPGYLLRYEWPFWVLDALPMLGEDINYQPVALDANYYVGVFMLFAIVHPGQYLPIEFRGWWLNTREIRNKAQSCPPDYGQATHLRGFAHGGDSA